MSLLPLFRGAMTLALLMPLTLVAAAKIPGATPAAQASGRGLEGAWAKAAQAGAPVEVPDRFTETMKVWADPDGKHLRAQLHTRPIQLKNPGTGVWEPIDTNIVARDGVLRTVRTKVPLSLGGRGSKSLVSAAGSNGTVNLSVKQALPEPKISGNTVTYPDAVSRGVDLVVRAESDGFVSQVVFRHRPTGPVTVRMPLTLPKGTTFGKTSQGLPQLKDGKGAAKAAPVVLTATDAKLGKASPVAARVEKSELVFSPDPKFLADPAVAFPVTVAAASEWFGGGVPQDAWVSKNDPYNNHAAEGWLRAGTTQTSADIARVYLRFNTDAPELAGASVVQADLIMWNYKSGGPNGALCGDPLGAGIVAARLGSSWSSTTLDWYNQPSTTGSAEGLNRAGYNYDAVNTWCAKDEEVWHRVTGMARAWIEQDAPNYGLMLRAASETAATNWRQYYASEFGGGDPYPGYRHPPALMVEYTPPPTRTEWVKFESDAELTEFPSYEEAKEMAAQPLDDASWGLTNEEADEFEKLGVGVPSEVDSRRLRPIPSDEEIDPADIEPDEVPSGDLPVDETKPTVTGVQPVAGSTNVPVDTTVTVTFGEKVWNPKIIIKDPSGTAAPGTTTWDATGQIATFTPAQPLKPSTAYSAEAREAHDEDGNEQDPHGWQFTTENDTKPPAVSAVTPAAQATDVPVATAVTATFTEPVDGAQLALKNPAGTSITGTSAMDPAKRVLTFTPAGPLAETTAYTAEVSGATDVAGNAMSSSHTWSFTTGVKPPTGLVASYGMNEGTGTSVGDSSGQSNAGTATNTTWSTNGRYGKALSFNGTSSLVTVADAPSLRLTGGLTLSAWVRPSSVVSWRSVVTKNLATGEGASYVLYGSNGEAPSGWLQRGGQPYQVSGGTPLAVNAWSHLTVTYDSADARLYVNGTQAARTPLTGPLDVDGGKVTIGGNTVWGEYFSGLIDEVRVYNRALDATQIQADMATPVGATGPTPTPTPTATPTPTPSPSPTGPSNPVPGLVAAYNMNQGSGTTVSDSSGQANSGAAHDTTWATNGRYGKALSFNGTSSLVTVTHAPSLRLTTALTLSAWVRPDEQSDWHTVVMKNLASGINASYGLYASDRDGPAGWLTTTGEPVTPQGPTALPDGTWSNVALTYDGSRATLYVNGTKAGEVAVTGTIDDDGGTLTIGGNEIWGEYFSGLIDEVRVYNRALTAAQIQSDMNTPIGAAPAAQRATSASSTTDIAKLAISGAEGTTPAFTTWVSRPPNQPAKVQVEVAALPEKSPTGKSAVDAKPIWSGTVTSTGGAARHTLRMPSGKLTKGQWVRWHARTTAPDGTGAWSKWQTFQVGEAHSAGKLPPQGAFAAADENTGAPFNYERIDRAGCNAARLSSPRPNHAFGWTVLRPYSACHSKILGWADFEVNQYTGLPTSRCPKSKGVMMTVNVIVFTNLGTTNGKPVVGAPADSTLTARDISLWTSITNIKTEAANCTPTNAFDGDTLRLRIDARGSDNSECTMTEGSNRDATIGAFKRDGEDAFVFQSQPRAWGNCTLRPKLFNADSFLFIDPTPFRLWQYLSTQNGPPTRRGDLPFVARCDSERIRYRTLIGGELKWTGNTGGCRFLGADRVYTMYSQDPDRWEVAQHIQFAFQNPQGTEPKVSLTGVPIAKSFPGNYDACGATPCAKVPLTKRANSARVPQPDGALYTSKNKYFRDKYRVNLPGYGPGKQCDEYPFASTNQALGIEGQMVNNVWTPSLNASLRMVTTAQNAAAGRDLGAFYARYRVFSSGQLEGGLQNRPSNAFFVRIKPGLPPAS